MSRYSVLALVILVVFALPFGVNAQRFPSGNYKYQPKQSPGKSTSRSTSTPGNASGVKLIQGPTVDFEKLRDLLRNSDDYNLGRKVAFLYMDGWFCSGFLVGPDLLLTNEHCVADDFGNIRNLKNCKVYINYYWNDRRGDVSAGVKQILKINKQLDYALLRLDRRLGDTYGWLDLDESSPNKYTRVKIIQHPRGRSKEIARYNSSITQVYSDMIHYQADTEGGSSGSPVFAVHGDSVIAIHHAGIEGYANEGVLMKRIVPQIRKWLPAPSASIEKIWMDYNEFKNGVKGMWIHVRFGVRNLKGKKVQVNAYFYLKDGTPLKDLNGDYCTEVGAVAVGQDATPRYVKATYKDFKLFMPYHELHIARGKYDLKFFVTILGPDGALKSQSDWQHFTQSVSAPK